MTNNVAVKICGLKDEAAVRAVITAKADYAGFVYFPASPRHVTLERAAQLKALLPPTIKSVSVLVDPDDALLAQVKSVLAPDYVQLHGKETPERVREIKKFGMKIIKAISVRSGDDVAQALRYADADILMFDADAASQRDDRLQMPDIKKESSLTSNICNPASGAQRLLPGGNGLSFDWALLKNREFPQPWFLSGGLNPGNVAEALRATGAKMADVSSGVESAPGVKDAGLIEAFVKAAKGWWSS